LITGVDSIGNGGGSITALVREGGCEFIVLSWGRRGSFKELWSPLPLVENPMIGIF